MGTEFDLDFDDIWSEYYYDDEGQLTLLKSFCDNRTVFWNDNNGEPEYYPEVIFEISNVFNVQEVTAIFAEVLIERGLMSSNYSNFVDFDAIPNSGEDVHEIRFVFDLREVPNEMIAKLMTTAKRLHTAFLVGAGESCA